ncbi:MAG: CbiX/SirB N-terminal domain-containing protein [Candidatus Sifarchaeia archaeon]
MTTILLAMHGSPPKDFPRSELMEFFKLHMVLDHDDSGIPQAKRLKHDELENKIRKWPRSSANDPFWEASRRLAEELSRITGKNVFVGFNDFCNPSIDDALEEVVLSGSNDVVVITPMMTPGGEHSEVDIPGSIQRAQERHPRVTFRYAWPFELASVARFLAEQISNH